jgi:hypothetical protein
MILKIYEKPYHEKLGTSRQNHMIKTFEENRTLSRELQICTIFESEKSGCLCVGQVFFVCCGQRPRRTTFPAFWNLVMGTASN